MSNVATDHVQMVYSDPHWDELRKENEVLKSSVSALKDAIEAQIYHFEAQMNNEDCGPWYEAVQDAKKLILDASTNSDVLREVTPQEAARVFMPMSTAPRSGETVLLKTSSGDVCNAWFARGEWSESTPISPEEYSGDCWVCCDDRFQIEVIDEGEHGFDDGEAVGWLPIDAIAQEGQSDG